MPYVIIFSVLVIIVAIAIFWFYIKGRVEEPTWSRVSSIEELGGQIVISCPTNKRLIVRNAAYGERTSTGTINPACAKDITSDLQKLVAGKSNYKFSNLNSMFGDPCPGKLKMVDFEYSFE